MRRPAFDNKETANRLLQALEGGARRKDACKFADINEQSFYNWKNRAERYETSSEEERDEKDAKFFEFFERIKKAESSCRISAVASIKKTWAGQVVLERRTTTNPDGSQTVIEKFAKPEWTAAAWYLERTDPDNFGRRETIKHQGDPEEPVVVKVISKKLSKAEWLANDIS